MTLYQPDPLREPQSSKMLALWGVPVEMVHVFTVGDPWDNEVWLPSLFPKGTRVAVIRIGGTDDRH